MNHDLERALENSRARWESRARRSERKLERLAQLVVSMPHQLPCRAVAEGTMCICLRGKLLATLEAKP